MMYFPLSWIQEWVDVSDLSPAEIAEALTRGGIEVDSFAPKPLEFAGVCVAKVVDAKPHPEADNLRVATVFDGTETFQVVCGAKNCQKGLVTAFAKIGAVLGDLKIKKAKLRGVESQGMLCAAEELGLPGDSSGIMELDATVGIDLADLYGDVIFEVSLTPNLGHCTSIMGLARELCALFGRSMQEPVFKLVESGKSPSVALSISDEKRCGRYAYRIVEGLKVGQSPDWLIKRLEACGVRSVNNVVDVTNYVMLERGQPLHAFDLGKIENNEIRIRSDLGEVELTTLDGEVRKVPAGTLLICDGKKPIAIAGLMGAANSEVDENTTTILIESACFSGRAVREASKMLQLRSEASGRFEKGVDPRGVLSALNRAASLIQSEAGGNISPLVEQVKIDVTPCSITCHLKNINGLLGTHLSLGDVEEIFNGLQFQTRSDNNETLIVTVPTFRRDISTETDLIEEVGRIYGYNNIAKRVMYIPPSTLQPSSMYLLEQQMRHRALGEGLTEMLSCNLIGPTDMPFVEDEQALCKVMHPSSIDQSILRPSLLPSVMQAVKRNADYQVRSLSAFEIGRLHAKTAGGIEETTAIGLVLTGMNRPHHFDPKPSTVDFYDLKGVVENLIDGNIQLIRSTHPLFHPGRQAHIMRENCILGVIGQVHPQLTDQDVYFAQVCLTEYLKLWSPDHTKQMTPLPLYPGSQRDWTVTLRSEQTVGSILDQLRSCRSKLLESVYLLDLYQGQNATFRFLYRHPQKTLPAEAVDREHNRLISSIL